MSAGLRSATWATVPHSSWKAASAVGWPLPDLYRSGHVEERLTDAPPLGGRRPVIEFLGAIPSRSRYAVNFGRINSVLI